MEQFPTIPWHFHLRMVSAMLLFLGADVAFISHAIDVTIRHGASMMIMFGFEVIDIMAWLILIVHPSCGHHHCDIRQVRTERNRFATYGGLGESLNLHVLPRTCH